jgi:hypothetical protein
MVERFHCTDNEEYDWDGLHSNPNGDLVLHEDYEALEAKLAALVEEVQDVINRGEVFDAKGTHSKLVCDKLKSAVEAAKVKP